MISYEIMHFMKRKTQGKLGWMALKLDMSKAYDRVEWVFRRRMLFLMGFGDDSVKLIMECVCLAKYQICHAGRRFGSIIPTRGIRQGDPLSSYLFLICMEGLSILLHEYEKRNNLLGIQIAKGAPRLTQMFFADDTYIFCKARVEEIEHVLDLLRVFEKASGQKINADKFSAFFTRNTDTEIREVICNMLKFKEADNSTTYLGLPNMMSKNKNVAMGYLKERLKDRVQGWEKKSLSRRGKEIMLKTVAQTLPNYAMSTFLFPQNLCDDMEKIMNQYWWKGTKGSKGIHWLSWDRMCMKKSSGGLGFRKLLDFNVALLGKQAWRLLDKPDSLVIKLYKARYFPDSSFLTAKVGSNPSYIWRSIMEAHVLLKQGAVRRVGLGDTIRIMDDPWLPDKDPYVRTNHEAIKHKMVDVLMNEDRSSWEVNLVKDIFDERDAQLILSIPLNGTDTDSWFWKYERLGHYSVKSAYAAIKEARTVNETQDSLRWNRLWSLQVPLKVKHFIWRAVKNILPIRISCLIKKFRF